MTEPLSRRGEIIDLHPSETTLDTNQQFLLVDSGDVKIIQLLVATGTEIPLYEAEGEVILHCLIGSVIVQTMGTPHELEIDQLLYLAPGEPFTIRARTQASVIVTIASPKQGNSVVLIGGSKPR